MAFIIWVRFWLLTRTRTQPLFRLALGYFQHFLIAGVTRTSAFKVRLGQALGGGQNMVACAPHSNHSKDLRV